MLSYNFEILICILYSNRKNYIYLITLFKKEEIDI